MEPKVVKLLAAVVLFTATSCQSDRHSSAGFRLPSGDIERGRTTFVALGCSGCHPVSGGDVPAPTVQPPVSVVLGGVLDYPMTDGYLVTSIINPKFRQARHPRKPNATGPESGMPHFDEQMSVRQLADIVAFLQSRYGVRRIPVQSYY